MQNHKKVALIVEDDQTTLNFIIRLLENNDYTVRSADNANQGLLLMDKDVEIVITDIHMPGLNGYSLAAMIKTQFPGTPVFGITGFREISEKTLHTEFDGSLYKPFRPKALLNAVNDLLKKFCLLPI